MQWKDGHKSENVEDRRGIRMSRGMMGGGIGTIIIVLVALYFGVDPSMLLNQGTTQDAGGPPGSVSRERPAEEKSFTHGSSEQRVRWFKRGNETGTFAQCDTFKTEGL